MDVAMGFVRRIYGASAVHLIVVIASFALAVYTISVVGLESLFNPRVWWQSIAVWFAVAIIGHDLILFPLYSLADRILGLGRPRLGGRSAEKRSDRTPLTNYIRMPTMASGLLLLLFLPGIIEQGAGSYQAATGLTQAPFLGRWLVLTAVFYVASALWYAAATVVRRRR